MNNIRDWDPTHSMRLGFGALAPPNQIIQALITRSVLTSVPSGAGSCFMQSGARIYNVRDKDGGLHCFLYGVSNTEPYCHMSEALGGPYPVVPEWRTERLGPPNNCCRGHNANAAR